MDVLYKLFRETAPITDKDAVAYLATCDYDTRKERCHTTKKILQSFKYRVVVFCDPEVQSSSDNPIEPIYSLEDIDSLTDQIQDIPGPIWSKVVQAAKKENDILDDIQIS